MTTPPTPEQVESLPPLPRSTCGAYTPAEMRAYALAALSLRPQAAEPAQELVLDKPAQVGNGRFGTGVEWSTVIGAAQRLYEHECTPEKEAARIARGRAAMAQFQRELGITPAAQSASAAEPATAEQSSGVALPWGEDDTMAIAAVRYCLGRMTYIVGDCERWLVRVWPHLRESAQRVIQRDIDEAFARDDDARADGREYKPLGHDCDRQCWERVRALWAASPTSKAGEGE